MKAYRFGPYKPHYEEADCVAVTVEEALLHELSVVHSNLRAWPGPGYIALLYMRT